MNAGTQFNYKFGNKANWRRWVWNRIAEQITVPAREAVVLYLAGPMDLDRPIAKSKGFKDHNLIAVESNKKSTQALRDQGAITINETLQDVINNWHGVPVDVVYADFCNSLRLENLRFSKQLLTAESFSESVIAVNLMRGREVPKEMGQDLFDILIKGKSRAEVFYEVHKGFSRLTFETGKCSDYGDLLVNPCPEKLYLFDTYAEKLKPAFNGYISNSGQRFDSAVFRNLSLFGFYRDAINEMRKANSKVKEAVNEAERLVSEFNGSKTAFRISAARAIRTRRATLYA